MKRRVSRRRVQREDFESNDNYSTAPDAVDAGDAHDNRELDKDNGPDKEPEHTEDPGDMQIMTKSGAATEILQQIQTMKTEDVIRLRNLLLGEEEGDERRGDDDLFDDETEEPVEDGDEEDDSKKEESYLGEEEEDHEEPDGDEEDEEEEDEDGVVKEEEEHDDEEDEEEEDEDEEEGEEGEGDKDDEGDSDGDDVEVNIGNLKKEDLKLGFKIGKLFEGQDFSPEFKSKVSEIFEAAVLANVNKMVGRINEMANRELRLLGKRQKARLTEHADRYLTSVARQFVRENKMAIDNGLKAELFESLVSDLSKVMKNHNLNVGGRKDLVEQLVARLDHVEGKLNEQIRVNMLMSEDLEALGREHALMEATAGLSSNQVDKLRALSEGFAYDDHDAYVAKIKDARERFLTEGGPSDRRPNRKARQEMLHEDLNPVTPSPENGVADDIVEVVAQQLARSAGKA